MIDRFDVSLESAIFIINRFMNKMCTNFYHFIIWPGENILVKTIEHFSKFIPAHFLKLLLLFTALIIKY